MEYDFGVPLYFQEVQKHSVHTLVFRSLKRTHDMFVADNGKPVPLDEERWVPAVLTTGRRDQGQGDLYRWLRNTDTSCRLDECCLGII